MKNTPKNFVPWPFDSAQPSPSPTPGPSPEPTPQPVECSCEPVPLSEIDALFANDPVVPTSL